MRYIYREVPLFTAALSSSKSLPRAVSIISSLMRFISRFFSVSGRPPSFWRPRRISAFIWSKTSQGLSQTSRVTRLSGTRLTVLPASCITATACSLHRLPLRWPPWSTANLDTAALLEYTMEEMKQENQEMAEEPAQSPPVERVTEKVKDPKKVTAGRVGAAAERQSKKNDFSSSFEHPRNHFATPLPCGRRHVCQYSSKGSGSGFRG